MGNERTRRVAFVLWVTLALNWGAALLKIVVGLIGIHLSGYPADDKHPYGRHKYETLASVVIGSLLLFVAFGIFQHAVSAFFHPHTPEVTPMSFWVMGLTLVMNLVVGVFAALVGIRLNFLVLDPIFSLGVARGAAYDGGCLPSPGEQGRAGY